MKRFDFVMDNVKGKILDIGSATGELHQRMKDNFDDVTGLDKVAGKNVDVVHDLNTGKLPFGDDYFDTIVLGETLEHVFQPKTLLEECKRVLKPRGTLLITTPNAYSIARFAACLINRFDPNKDHYHIWDEETMGHLLREVGFASQFVYCEGFNLFKKRWGMHLCVFAVKP